MHCRSCPLYLDCIIFSRCAAVRAGKVPQATKTTSLVQGLATWLLKPSDDSKGLPLAETRYFKSGAHVVNGALEKVVFPLLIAFPLCATAVIVAGALFSGTPGCSKMTFWVQGDVKQAINRCVHAIGCGIALPRTCLCCYAQMYACSITAFAWTSIFFA